MCRTQWLLLTGVSPARCLSDDAVCQWRDSLSGFSEPRSGSTTAAALAACHGSRAGIRAGAHREDARVILCASTRCVNASPVSGDPRPQIHACSACTIQRQIELQVLAARAKGTLKTVHLYQAGYQFMADCVCRLIQSAYVSKETASQNASDA